MVAECASLFNQESHFAVLVKRLDCFIINKLDYRTVCLLVLVLLSGVIEDGLLAVAELEARLLVRLDLGGRVGWHEVHVCLFLGVSAILGYTDL